MMPVQRTIYLLMFDAFGQGGEARATLMLANRLAERHRVEVISVVRRRAVPGNPLDPAVRLTALRDAGSEGMLWSALRRRPSRLSPEPVETDMSRLTDVVLRRKLSRLAPGTLISTRPSLHLAAVRFAPDHVRLLGQDHMSFTARFANPRQVDVLYAAIPALDAYTVLTDADVRDYARRLPWCAERIVRMPNMLPWPYPESPAGLVDKVVVAAGCLETEKGFRRLVRAFEPVARRHPEWKLRIYGEGSQRTELEQLVRDLGLGERVDLPGHTDDLRTALAEASVFALSSYQERFGMALIEAMSVGVPPVSFDCARGPGEIIAHDENGLLIDDGDLNGFSAALESLIGDQPRRRRLGMCAWQDAAAYTPARVLDDWEDLLDRVEGSDRHPVAM